MVVIVLTAVPAGLRGFLTRWLLEIAPGVFVGRISHRIRTALWFRVVEMSKDGRAIMVFAADNEQRYDFRVHRHDWTVEDLDGVKLIRRPAEGDTRNPMRRGWSKAARYRRQRRKGD